MPTDLSSTQARKMTEIILQRIKMHGSYEITNEVLKHLGVITLCDHAAQKYITHITTKVMGLSRAQKKEVLFEVPAGRWQHFKAAVFPTFLLRAFPIKTKVETKEVEFIASAIFPEIEPIQEQWFLFVDESSH